MDVGAFNRDCGIRECDSLPPAGYRQRQCGYEIAIAFFQLSEKSDRFLFEINSRSLFVIKI